FEPNTSGCPDLLSALPVCAGGQLSRTPGTCSLGQDAACRDCQRPFPLPFRCPGGCLKGIGSLLLQISESAQRRADKRGRHAYASLCRTCRGGCRGVCGGSGGGASGGRFLVAGAGGAGDLRRLCFVLPPPCGGSEAPKGAGAKNRRTHGRLTVGPVPSI